MVVLPDNIQVPLGALRRSGSYEEPFAIGEHVVVIYPKKGRIKCFPTKPGDRRPPLRYFGDGDYCLGNIENAMYELVREKEFALAADLFARYLETGIPD